jgi:2-keto-4-pentenoate hydratase/2-oxohepta-3-ene-1,7-dioic acid hydratase in catechol pathway
MKFLRIGPMGHEVPCVLDADGVARNISSLVADIGPATMPGLIAAVSGVDLSALPEVATTGARIGSPIARPNNVWCIGLNYADHAEEAGMPIPEEPIIFSKSSLTVCGPNDPILKSTVMTKLDWEVELGIVIGAPALEIAPDAAMDHVMGYVTANDVSERAWQIERGGTWIKGKTYPNFCPTGPWLVTADEVPDPQALALSLSVNGKVMQDGTTATMIFGVAHIVHYLSQFAQLEPGDLILTGTPPGVGMGMKPPRYLEVGDTVTLSVEGLGQQESLVEAS